MSSKGSLPSSKPLPKNGRQHPAPSASGKSAHNTRVNWHKAAVCAIKIELRDYADILQFLSEYVLGKNSYRIDFLIIKKLSEQPVPKNFSLIFRKYNLFEFKGMHSSLTVNSYYKTIGYAGLLIDQAGRTEPCTALDVSLSFLTFRHPRSLLKHLQKERHLKVEKSSQGIYDINKETFKIQIIVIRELPPAENLYLCCLSDRLQDASLTNRLADDYNRHNGQQLYADYLQQLTNAHTTLKGDPKMVVCEGLLNMFGTSSEELIAKGKKESDDYYLPKINELTVSNEKLTFSNKKLASQNDYLKNLLRKNNISFDNEAISTPKAGYSKN